MQMMYQIIAKEIKSMELDSHPEDYLSFFCLGNRELMTNTAAEPGSADKVFVIR